MAEPAMAPQDEEERGAEGAERGEEPGADAAGCVADHGHRLDDRSRGELPQCQRGEELAGAHPVIGVHRIVLHERDGDESLAVGEGTSLIDAAIGVDVVVVVLDVLVDVVVELPVERAVVVDVVDGVDRGNRAADGPPGPSRDRRRAGRGAGVRTDRADRSDCSAAHERQGAGHHDGGQTRSQPSASTAARRVFPFCPRVRPRDYGEPA
jgi:hypothetical protein